MFHNPDNPTHTALTAPYPVSDFNSFNCQQQEQQQPQFPDFHAQGYAPPLQLPVLQQQQNFGVYQLKPYIQLRQTTEWKEFSSEFKEMFVNNSGRELFPMLTFSACDLYPDLNYYFSICLVRMGNLKWKYENDEWIEDATSNCTDVPQQTPFFHSSIKSGKEWMETGLTCPKIFTVGADNKTKKGADQSPEAEEQRLIEKARKVEAQMLRMLRVHTRVKYYPFVKVWRINELGEPESVAELHAPEASFITVTAYKSPACSAMKTFTNKFVRGDFRSIAMKKMEALGKPVKVLNSIKSSKSTKSKKSKKGSKSTGPQSPPQTDSAPMAQSSPDSGFSTGSGSTGSGSTGSTGSTGSASSTPPLAPSPPDSTCSASTTIAHPNWPQPDYYAHQNWQQWCSESSTPMPTQFEMAPMYANEYGYPANYYATTDNQFYNHYQ